MVANVTEREYSKDDMVMNVKTSLKAFFSLVILFFLFPTPAHAHLIGGNGLMSGATHPFFGLDHLLAMVAVGIMSAQLGGKAIWRVPVAFVSFMTLGGALALVGAGVPYVETGIALSVLLLGVGIALSKKLPFGMALSCVAVFALLHGHVHGEEMPSLVHPALYALGFVLSTTLLHLMGVVLGQQAKKTHITVNMLRVSGAVISMAGLYFLLGL